MRSKLMTTLFFTVLSLTAAPLAIEQLDNLRGVAEKWTRTTFLNGVGIAHASEQAPVQSEPMQSNTTATNSSDEFQWKGRVASGSTVEIKGINGSINAEASSSGEVEVTALKSGRRSDSKQVEIRVVEHSGGVTICAVYPSDDPNRLNDCQPGEGGHSNVHDNDVQVEFKVRVPQGVGFRGRTVNGDVETGALTGDVDAATVNGSIKINSAQIAKAKTVNGSITASFSNANWNSLLEFKTVNGGITLNLPSNTSADVHADTLNGDISTDFPLTVLGTVSRRRLDGTIGSGGRGLSLKTVNGSIRLRRAS